MNMHDVLTKSPETIAEYLSSRDRFKGGAADGLRVLNVYLAYAGKRLSSSRRHRIERAKEMLNSRIRAAENRQLQAG